MAFCSIDEAYGNQPPPGLHSASNDIYTSVNYEDSNIHKYDGSQQFSQSSQQNSPPKRIPNMSRTNERLPQHSGPKNRYTSGEKNVILTYTDDNKYSYSEDVQNNNEVPLSAHSRRHKSKKTYSTPIHDIMLKSQSIRSDDSQPDLNDTVNTILNKNNDTSNSDTSTSNDTSTISEIHIRNKIVKNAPKHVTNVNNIIDQLTAKNAELEAKIRHLQKKLKRSGNSGGIFTTTDLVIVGVLGVLMIIVLQVVYKIATSIKN
jgi:hypothetical protein